VAWRGAALPARLLLLLLLLLMYKQLRLTSQLYMPASLDQYCFLPPLRPVQVSCCIKP